MGVESGDRVAYIAPNTHAQLKSFLCRAVDRRRARSHQLSSDVGRLRLYRQPQRRSRPLRARRLSRRRRWRPKTIVRRRAIRGARGTKEGWLDYEGLIESESGAFAPVKIDEDDLITINYTSGTTARPKGVMITHRNAYLNVLGTLAHFQMSPDDQYLWTLPMFHANGWTFVWAVTARGSSACLSSQGRSDDDLRTGRTRSVTTLCAAPTVLIGIADAPEAVRKRAAGKVVRLLTAGAPPAASPSNASSAVWVGMSRMSMA